MNSVEKHYLSSLDSVNRIQIPQADKIIVRLLILFIVAALLLLNFTPWIQTAYGTGTVSSLSPENRIQAISALVEGQIKQWHVKEGDRIRAGDPIVTLIDTDQSLIVRLNAQIEAIGVQQAANESAIRTTKLNLARQKRLLQQGLVSQRDVEQVQVKLDDLSARAAKSIAELNKLKVSQARQSIQTKTAPTDGTIVRLLSAGNSTHVKSGQALASFIPDEVERSVVITVNGLDAPLVKEGRKVRLQFDGWPVFQFSGWPSTAVGTFGGVVEFVEPIADQHGRFKVWVKEDASEQTWPSSHYARLGSRVRGWILLEEVKLGYELWRQLNNFPPINAETHQSKE